MGQTPTVAPMPKRPVERPPTLATAKTLGERIQAAYLSKGMSRSAVVRATGFAATTIIAWETGKSSPGTANLKAFAAAVGVPFSALVPDGAPDYDSEDPAELAEFLSTPLGTECTPEERDHLRWYYSSAGPLRSLAAFQQVLQTFRSVRDERGPGTRRVVAEAARAEDQAAVETHRKEGVKILTKVPKRGK